VRIAAALAMLPIVAGFLALITYRIQTQTGELVIESDDPNIEVIVKQGGQRVTIVDPKTKDSIELKAGRYELQLAGGGDGFKLSTDAFTLKRGDKTVVTVRRGAPSPASRPPAGESALVEVATFRGHYALVDCAVVSPDGWRILSGSRDGMLILWDRETGRSIRRFKGHGGAVISVAFAPDGRRALSGDGAVVRLWDLESGQTIHEFHGHTECVFSVAFSPDGRLGYSTSGFLNNLRQLGTDSPIRVWDLETGQEVRKLEGHEGNVWSVAVSRDGRHVLSGGNDMTSILWDAKTGAEIRRFRGHTDGVQCVAFLPDGRRAVSCSWDRTIRLWDVETSQEIHCFRGHLAEVTWVAVSPDGSRLLSCEHNGPDLRLWDVEARKEVHRINWGNVNPTRGSFTPDGRHAVWAGTDGVIRMYRLSAPDQVKADHAAAPTQPVK
jgi:WD40 repeat protein